MWRLTDLICRFVFAKGVTKDPVCTYQDFISGESGHSLWQGRFIAALYSRNPEMLMVVVYDELHIYPKRARKLAGRIVLCIADHYVVNTLLRGEAAEKERSPFQVYLFDICFALPELHVRGARIRQKLLEASKRTQLLGPNRGPEK